MKFALILFFCTPLMAAEPTLVYFVRHAEKVDASENPDLSPAGLKRVALLRKFLGQTKLDMVVATQYTRTKKTVAPMAADRNLRLIIVPAGEPEKLITTLKDNPGKTILVAGHSNTVPDLIGRLGCTKPSIDETQYSFLFLVVFDGSHCNLQTWQLDP